MSITTHIIFGTREESVISLINFIKVTETIITCANSHINQTTTQRIQHRHYITHQFFEVLPKGQLTECLMTLSDGVKVPYEQPFARCML